MGTRQRRGVVEENASDAAAPSAEERAAAHRRAAQEALPRALGDAEADGVEVHDAAQGFEVRLGLRVQGRVEAVHHAPQHLPRLQLEGRLARRPEGVHHALRGIGGGGGGGRGGGDGRGVADPLAPVADTADTLHRAAGPEGLEEVPHVARALVGRQVRLRGLKLLPPVDRLVLNHRRGCAKGRVCEVG